jgi:uncharacterized protein YneF (UPF0154 family)
MFIVGLIAGSFICGIYFSRKISQVQKECGKQAIISNVPKINIPDQIFGIGGSIEKINGNTIAINASLYVERKKYTVKVVDSTKIIKRKISQNPTIPKEGKISDPFEETEIKLSDLRVNDSIGIVSSENIKDKTSFEAKIISLDLF